MKLAFTLKQICEHIVKADILSKTDGTKPTAKEIFESSPSGELWHVFELYDIACKKLRYAANN